MIPRHYNKPYDFKQALEVQVRARAGAAAIDIAHCRQLYVFDRLLARLSAHFGDRVIVKGSVVLELRLGRARVTRDVDLGIQGNPEGVLFELRRAGELSLHGDFLTYTFEPDADHPRIEAEGLLYGGRRFRAKAILAEKIYGYPFGVDVVFGDPMAAPPEKLTGRDLFAFAGMPRTEILAYAREVHIAEKLHALTMRRSRENSRVKDLPDIALLGTTGPFQCAALRDTIKTTFEVRGMHTLPHEVPALPERWSVLYARMAKENTLRWTSLEELFEAVSAFLNPVLRGEDGIWDPDTWSWRGRASP